MKKILFLSFSLLLIFLAAFYLINQKAGQNKNTIRENKIMLTITSSVFKQNEEIPEIYTCRGQGINPPLEISGVPSTTKSLALILDDPDAPSGTFNHWLIWNINPNTQKIKEGQFPNGAVVGKNSSGQNNYVAPCPPSGIHRYFFKFYALDEMLNIAESSNKSDLENAMQNHIIAQGELMGTVKSK